MAKNNARLINEDVVGLYNSAGINPVTGQPTRVTDNKSSLKNDIRKQLRIIDEQDAVNRYVWYNLPCDLTGQELERMLTISKQLEGPVLIHVLTKKGKGYEIAEKNPDKFHATAPFDIKTGKTKTKKGKDYSKVFGDKLIELAIDNDILCCVASGNAGDGKSNTNEISYPAYLNNSIAIGAISIDDKIENLINGDIKLLYTAYHNKNISKEELEEKGIIRVNNWLEIEKILLN